MIQNLKEQFLHPSDEFTLIPFWFWNDALDEKEITRQINDFCAKGINGFVIHPRMGIPEDIPYLSDKFMHYVKYTVEEAHKRSMQVVLYDEAMYPSGSAHGMVVKDNPEYATRALRMEEAPIAGEKEAEAFLTKLTKELTTEDIIVSIQLVQKDGTGAIDPDHTKLLFSVSQATEDAVSSAASLADTKAADNAHQSAVLTALSCLKELAATQTASDNTKETLSLCVLIAGFSHGTIRGIHPGEDDGEPNAPISGDLMNPDAMDKFIHLTHDRYYEVLKEYFGNTVIAMFTDEPDVLGRNHRAGSKPWTIGFMDWWLTHGGKEEQLPLLWLEGTNASQIRRQYEKAVNKRLGYAYYGKLSVWCAAHGIALTGHPHKSDEIGFLKYFQIPGQDLVWRWVAPENHLGLEGLDTTMAKCSSDAARHAGKRRNSNECFGCCGPDGNQWAFAPDDMKWYLDWMFVRGVNLLYPHAFFYSLAGERRYGERPPDAGLNNVWWKDYGLFSDYSKRMSFLMTDSHNTTPVAILCEEDLLPWAAAKVLFQNQIEFNYLEDNLLLDGSCKLQDGLLKIEKQSYRILIVEATDMLSPALKEKLSDFTAQGGIVIVPDSLDAVSSASDKEACTDLAGCTDKQTSNAAYSLSAEGFYQISSLDGLPALLTLLSKKDSLCQRELLLTGTKGLAEDIRISHVVKEQYDFYVCVNEGELPFAGTLTLPFVAKSAQVWDPWAGTCEPTKVSITVDGQLPDNDAAQETGTTQTAKAVTSLPVALNRRESIVFCIARVDDEATDNRLSGSTHNTADPKTADDSLAPLSLPLTWKIIKAVQAQAVISSGLSLGDAPAHLAQWDALQEPLPSWTQWPEMENFSGDVTYETTLELSSKPSLTEPSSCNCAEASGQAKASGELLSSDKVILDLGDVCEIARLTVNGTAAGVRLWAPYTFDLTGLLQEGVNTISVEVSNALANGMSHSKLPSGLLGPVNLLTRK